MDFLVVGKTSVISFSFEDYVVEIGSEREFLILVCVLKLPNKPQNYFLKTNELNYKC